MVNQLELFEQSLPAKPYCTDFLGSLLIRPKGIAIRHKYIQQNNPNSKKWLVYDVDRETSFYDWNDRGCPAPNVLAMNRENGNSHLFYSLENPIHFNHNSRENPQRYAAAIDIALSQKLDADPGYVGLISKNMLHPNAWHIARFQPHSYDLEWLAGYLDLTQFQDRRKRLPETGLGRNCTLFDVTRFWAYRKIREPWLSPDFFKSAVEEYALGYNALHFKTPLPHREVLATVKSISKWTWQHMSPEGFQAWCSRRGKKSGRVRAAKAKEKRELLEQLLDRNPHLTYGQLAFETGYSLRTVKTLLAGFR